MNYKTYFILGMIISPLLFGFIWLLESKPSGQPEIKAPVVQQKSLSSINFIPSTTRKQVTDQSFSELSLTDAEQKLSKKLSDYVGKPIILHFWATWCGACVEELPELDVFSEKFGNLAHIIVVASDQTQGKAVREFYQKNNIKNLSLFIDEQGRLAREFSVSVLPTTIFISSNSKEMGKITGPIDWVGESGQILSVHLTKKK